MTGRKTARGIHSATATQHSGRKRVFIVYNTLEQGRNIALDSCDPNSMSEGCWRGSSQDQGDSLCNQSSEGARTAGVQLPTKEPQAEGTPLRGRSNSVTQFSHWWCSEEPSAGLQGIEGRMVSKGRTRNGHPWQRLDLRALTVFQMPRQLPGPPHSNSYTPRAYFFPIKVTVCSLHRAPLLSEHIHLEITCSALSPAL